MSNAIILKTSYKIPVEFPVEFLEPAKKHFKQKSKQPIKLNTEEEFIMSNNNNNIKTVWLKYGEKLYLRPKSEELKEITSGIYKLHCNEHGELYLVRTADNFTFNYKMYGLEKDFINRIAKSYDKTNNNMGILLNGLKGTGKTVTAKQICNILNLPIILVSEKFDNLPNFINNLQQNILLFIDEYEKIYDRDSNILTIMDGILDNGYRRVFLLTTNELTVNKNILERPGRIRYLKRFSDLQLETIQEIVEDLLEYKEYHNDIMDFISKLSNITIDIVKAIVQEVNIHAEPPLNFKNCFNVVHKPNSYNIYRRNEKGNEHRVRSEVILMPTKFEPGCEGTYVYADRELLGVVTKYISDEAVMLQYDGEYDSDNKPYIALTRFEDLNFMHESFAKKHMGFGSSVS